METNRSKSIVFIYVKLPIAINERQLLNHPQVSALFAELDIFSKDIEELFFKDKSQGQFVKVAEGAFLADEDAWYPNILSMIKWCDEKKFPYAIVPVGDSPATFSGENHDITRWLAEKGKRARVSRLVLPQPAR